MNKKEGIILDSPRLTIIPLTHSQLIKYLKTDNSLENELQLAPLSRIISPELIEPLQNKILPAVADSSNNFLFYTLWTMINKQERVLVGDLCFKGPPNEEGDIEIGYGTYPSFQQQGYITEVIGALIRWASVQPEVNAITAETNKTNIASIRALEKNNFQQFKTTEAMIWWRLRVK